MTTDFDQHRADLRDGYRRLYAAIPDTMTGFDGLHRAAVANGALSRANKELIALGIGIAARCGGCITLHVQAAVAAGATPEEVREAIGVAVLMGGGPASTYAIEALDALDHFSAAGD